MNEIWRNTPANKQQGQGRAGTGQGRAGTGTGQAGGWQLEQLSSQQEANTIKPVVGPCLLEVLEG